MKRGTYIKAGLPLCLGSVAVLFCTSNVYAKGREFEKFADCEEVEVAQAVQAALTTCGYQSTLVELDPGRIFDLKKYSWVFNLAETIYGFPLTVYEIAEKLEQLNINFTGSGSSALKACANKAFTKNELIKYGILTPAFEVYLPGEPVHCGLKFPVIVKPVHEDGSIGISADSVASNGADLRRLVERTHTLYGQAALVEEFIDGKDVMVSILGNGAQAVIFPPSEIIFLTSETRRFLTFDAKWTAQSDEYKSNIVRCPCELETGLKEQICQTALRAYELMGCRDYARVDFRVKDNDAYLLEINPNPSINPDGSGFVLCGNAQGLSYDQRINQIFLSSLKSHYLQDESKSVGNRYESYIEAFIKQG
jgi:D-alanine-D-alanine ligase